MKKLFVLSALLIFVVALQATTIIVDQNGGGQFTTIQAAINAASSGDTVKVWPGTYSTEQINLNKNIVLAGSGCENTIINGNYNPILKMNTGKLQWFLISSSAGVGINISGGLIQNCCIVGCSSDGILNNTSSTSCTIINCVLYNNVGRGISSQNQATINVTNCISRNNGSYGFGAYPFEGINLSYSNGSRNYTIGNQGCIDIDPGFTSPPVDFHISEGGPCWNTGNPSSTDPDGSRSDMGYFGGPDCPIYPTVVEILIEPNGNSINLKAKARANY